MRTLNSVVEMEKWKNGKRKTQSDQELGDQKNKTNFSATLINNNGRVKLTNLNDIEYEYFLMTEYVYYKQA